MANVAKLAVQISGSSTELQASLTESEQRVKQFKQNVESQKPRFGESLEDGLKSFNKSIKGSVTAILGLGTAFAAVIGTATVFYNLGQKIRDVFTGGSNQVAETLAKYNEMSVDDPSTKSSLKKDLTDVTTALGTSRAFRLMQWDFRSESKLLALKKNLDEQLSVVGMRESQKKEAEYQKKVADEMEVYERNLDEEMKARAKIAADIEAKRQAEAEEQQRVNDALRKQREAYMERARDIRESLRPELKQQREMGEMARLVLGGFLNIDDAAKALTPGAKEFQQSRRPALVTSIAQSQAMDATNSKASVEFKNYQAANTAALEKNRQELLKLTVSLQALIATLKVAGSPVYIH